MVARYRPDQAKLSDSQQHGDGAELLLVEGDSALASVCAVRDPRTQAVLALQGKPLNAWHANATRVAQHAQYRLLAQALGLAAAAVAGSVGHGQPDPHTLRYERVVLLFDPDADGIHIGALLVLYVQRWLPWLIQRQQLWQVRAPMFELVAADSGEVLQADNPVHCQALATRMAHAASGARPRVQAYRGLGGIAPDVLRSRCVDPSTRQAHAVGAADVQSVVDVFGGRPRA